MEISWRVIPTIRKDLLHIFRDRITVLILLLQPIIIVVLTGLTFQSGIQGIPLVLVQHDQGPIAEAMVRNLMGSNVFSIISIVGSEDDAEQIIRQGRAEGAIVIPADFSQTVSGGGRGHMKILIDGSKPLITMTLSKLGYGMTSGMADVASSQIKGKISTVLSQARDARDALESVYPMFYETNPDSWAGNLVELQALGLVVPQAGQEKYSQYAPGLSSTLSDAKYLSDAYPGLLYEQQSGMTTIASGIMRQSADYSKIADSFETIGSNSQKIGQGVQYYGGVYNDTSLATLGAELQYMGKQSVEVSRQLRNVNITGNISRQGDQLYSGILASGDMPGIPSIPSIPGATATQVPPPNYAPALQASQEGARSLLSTLDIDSLDLDRSFETIPIEVDYKILYNGDKLRIIDLIIPMIIMLSVAFGAVVSTAPTIARERVVGTLERLQTTPIKSGDILLGKIFSSFVFAMLQAEIMLLVAVLCFQVNIAGDLWIFTLLLIPVCVAHLGMGVFISSICKNDREAVQSIPIVMVVFIILSGMIIPIELLPPYVRTVSNFIPLTYANNIALGIMIKGGTLADFWMDAVLLVVFSLLFIIGGIFAFYKYAQNR